MVSALCNDHILIHGLEPGSDLVGAWAGLGEGSLPTWAVGLRAFDNIVTWAPYCADAGADSVCEPMRVELKGCQSTALPLKCTGQLLGAPGACGQ